MVKKKVCIIGMGPSGLMAGTVLLERGFDVHFFDHKKAAGRKFLVAGNGGFNLTHSEDQSLFLERYNHSFVQNAFLKFDNHEWMDFLESIGIKTYIGSSGKIFPIIGIKPIEVLSNWLNRISLLGGVFHYSHSLTDFNETEIILSKNDVFFKHSYDYLVLALGGGSWKKTGSTGTWIDLLMEKDVECIPFEASNAGFDVYNWEKIAELEGQRIKNVEVRFGESSRLGDVVITKTGLEGAPIYFINKDYRANRSGKVIIDLKPNKTKEEIQKTLTRSKNSTEGLKNLNLSKTVIQLIKLRTTKEEFSSTENLATILKELKFQIQGLRPIDEAISTVGGVSMDAIHENFQLKKFPKVFVCGEMLDWDAPTGGYLIQGCVSTGRMVGTSI